MKPVSRTRVSRAVSAADQAPLERKDSKGELDEGGCCRLLCCDRAYAATLVAQATKGC